MAQRTSSARTASVPRLQGGAVVQVPPGGGITLPQALDGAFRADGAAARRPWPGREVTHMGRL